LESFSSMSIFSKQCVRLLSFILLALVLAEPCVTSSATKQNPQFKVEVNLVFLDLEVLDPNGTPITGLDSDDIVIKENGISVEISNFTRLTDLSLSLVVSLGTGFMPQANLGIAKNAVFQLIHLLKPDDEICLFTFDQRNAYLEQEFTRERPKLTNALENIGVTRRSRRPHRFLRSFTVPTQIGLGLDVGITGIKKGANQRKALLLIRDRVESLGPASLEHIQESGATLIALGFSEDTPNRLMLINDQSGTGQLMLGPEKEGTSDENGNVTELCRTIAHLLSSRYSLAYQTPLHDPRSSRDIEVTAPGHNYRILARRSYAPSGGAPKKR
jgi:hypothetical protein